MRIRRTFPLVLAVVLVAAALTLVVQLRKHAPPEAARLLPGADAFLYINLKWVRAASPGSQWPPVTHDPEYERFIQRTGFQFERDLDQAAFAVHYPENWPRGGTGGSAPEPRFSEVLIGKFHSENLSTYLKQVAQSVENYNSVDIFTVPLDGRSLRIAVLSVDSVAASNHDNADVIRGIVDRSRRLASPFGGPALVRRFYKHVQFGSVAWAIARVDPAAPDFGGLSALFAKPTELVASGSYLSPLHLRAGVLHLRAEAYSTSSDDARSIADKVNVFLALFHSAESSIGTKGNDADVKTFFDSIQVRPEHDRAVLDASVSSAFLRKLLAEPPSELPVPGPQSPQPHSPESQSPSGRSPAKSR